MAWALSQGWIGWNTTSGSIPAIQSDGQEITWALYERQENLWATLPPFIIFNSKLEPFPRINNSVFQMLYKAAWQPG